MAGLIIARVALGFVLVVVALAASAADLVAQEIKLKLSHYAPPSHVNHVGVVLPWVEEVKRRTGGRVEITVFPGASLCKPTQQYDCAKSGIADISLGIPAWSPGRFPMTSVLELPFLYHTAGVGSQILADLWDQYLKKEYGDVHVLFMFAAPAFHIHTSVKPVRTAEDLKGMKIRVPSAVVGDILDILGATKVGMPADQIYEAMSQRLIDGFALTYQALLPNRLQEVSRYHTEAGMSSIVFASFMNKARYESLPPDVRRVLDETTSAAGDYWRHVGEVYDKSEVAARKAVLDRKNEIHVLSQEERRRWREALKGLDDKWAAALEARGLPGRALAREARTLAARYREAD